ncbi:hypothetical protein MY3296_009079 [Beauveria thailandica]
MLQKRPAAEETQYAAKLAGSYGRNYFRVESPSRCRKSLAPKQGSGVVCIIYARHDDSGANALVSWDQ